MAALAHAELITVRPFSVGNAVLARAVARAVVVGRGLDPTGVAVWEAAHLEDPVGYERALRGFASGGSPEAAAWVGLCVRAVVRGVEEGRIVCDAVLAGEPAAD